MTASGSTDSILENSSSSTSTLPRSTDADSDVLSVPDNAFLDANIMSDDEEFAGGYASTTFVYFIP